MAQRLLTTPLSWTVEYVTHLRRHAVLIWYPMQLAPRLVTRFEDVLRTETDVLGWVVRSPDSSRDYHRPPNVPSTHWLFEARTERHALQYVAYRLSLAAIE